MKVLTQYKSDSLNNHLSRAWRMTAFLGHYVEAVPAQMRTGMDWYKGSADAIYQNLNIITDEEPDHIFVFGADHVYRMDVRQMLDFHLRAKADCTVAAIPVPIEQGREFGIIDVGPDGRDAGASWRSRRTRRPCPGNPKMCLASMGNYLFDTDDAGAGGRPRRGQRPERARLRQVASSASCTSTRRVYVYDFAQNSCPGRRTKERGYWRDVGNIDVYYQANMDLVEVDPIFNLYNDRWPIYTQHQQPTRRRSSSSPTRRTSAWATPPTRWCARAASSPAARAPLACSRPKVRVNSFSEVSDCILFENVTMGRRCRIRRAIIDKNVEIPAGDDHRLRRGGGPAPLPRHREGVVVIPKGMKVASGGA